MNTFYTRESLIEYLGFQLSQHDSPDKKATCKVLSVNMFHNYTLYKLLDGSERIMKSFGGNYLKYMVFSTEEWANYSSSLRKLEKDPETGRELAQIPCPTNPLT